MDAPVRVGEVIAGKYRIDRLIGQGGMGVVLAAEHLALNVPVAIKFLLADAGEDVVMRFEREARAAASISSVHVSRVMDIDQLPTGEPYIVMELLDGADLDQLLEERGPLPVGEAIDYLLQACQAIGLAHGQGIVHRDASR